MRIGISPFASTRDGALSLAGSAVEGGMDTLWLGDGYLANPDFEEWSGGLESMTELAFFAGRFPKARVGITAAVLPVRDIVWTAKQANTIARLAGGGFVLVVTPGFWRQDLEARGQDYDRRGRIFDTRLDELLAALDDPGFSPGPTDEAAPVWLAGAGATMDRALRRGLPFQS
ncbi:MAG: LLM class flavin-dependent oxidoreductase, partial [Acidimicrobiales bacterium]